MNVIIIFNKRKHKINIHKYDSVLSIKNIINKIIFNNEYNINDIQLFHNNNDLKNDDYCDKFNIKENDNLNVHLKKKGGNLMKKILFYIVCIIIILVPFFILPTGINTGGVTIISLIMSRAKDAFSRFLLCELKYRTLTTRFGNIIDFIKYFLFIMATYTLITVGCITACCMTKGEGIESDPNKICTPYYVGSTAGLILTVIYFFMYFMMRFGDQALKPLIKWSEDNFVTNLLVKPFILKPLYIICNRLKFVFAYCMPFGLGLAIKMYHEGIDSTFPGLLVILETVSEAGCSIGNLKKLMKNMEGKFKKMSKNGKENGKDEKSNSGDKNIGSSGSNNDAQSGGNSNFNLYNFKFENGIIDNSKYETDLNEARSKIIVKKHPLCEEPAGGSCCNKDMILQIAEMFQEQFESPIFKTQVHQCKEAGAYLGINLALIGMYEKALYNDEVPLDFKNKNIIEKKILLKIFLENYREELLKSDKKNNGKKIFDNVEKILNSKDEDFPEDEKFESIENDINKFVHKDDLKDQNKIDENKKKIIALENKNIEYAKHSQQNYQAGDSPTKFFIKNVFINSLCNVFTLSKSGVSLINEIGGVNQLADILKCGSASGVIMAFIYLIVVIVLIICGILRIY